MENKISPEIKLSLVATSCIVTASLSIISEPIILDTPKQHFLLIILLSIIFLGMFFISKRIMSRFYVRDKVYYILDIETETKQMSFGAFGRWNAVNVYIKEKKTGKSSRIEMYPELTKELHIGQEVGLVKRPARHTYEMDTFYLIPTDKFNVKKERQKYVKNIEMEGAPYTGWLITYGLKD